MFNVLPGYGHAVGKALALHMDVDCLVFTGSTNVAKQLMIYAGQSNMKRVWLEAGGKSPNIVFADAPDLKKAAAEAASAIAFNQGEVCTAGSRLLVENSIRSEFVGLIREALKTWRPGHPLDPATTVAQSSTRDSWIVLSTTLASASLRAHAWWKVASGSWKKPADCSFSPRCLMGLTTRCASPPRKSSGQCSL